LAQYGDPNLKPWDIIVTMREIIGDYAGFFSLQNERLNEVNIDISGCALSHLAYRTETYSEYLRVREKIEKHCTSNTETVWNGRPISIMQLDEALNLGNGFTVRVIELIPPVHRRVYKMGLEHIGVVIGATVDEFSRRHRSALTGQQFQSAECEPYYITFFQDFTMVKFYDLPLLELCKSQHGKSYTGFTHVDNWSP